MAFYRIESSTSLLFQRLSKAFNYVSHDFWDIEGDKRVSQYPFFTTGPWVTMALIGLYLLFVKHFGPQWMRDRKPFDLKPLMVVYNVTMVIVSAYLFIVGCWRLNFGLDTWGCRPVNQEDTSSETSRFLLVAWLFFFSKLVEFADTIFFVLRKKNSQISNLHVIHHSIVPISVWIGFKFAPGGNNAFFPLMNSGIHTLMYSYYGLTVMATELGIGKQLSRWKKYLTAMQMGQFVLAIIHGLTSLAINDCPFPKSSLFINLGNAILFLVLFYSFYRKSYMNKISQIKKCT
ncbi:very long chain fatty acid elongase 7-like [Brevipalpus obovatus]|uniref:very long chain fatty acid elongase 7-like n=1 Tax=Brevipalpus obovatus TaxID=246614 RepID=UPI003D9F53D0